MRYTRAKQRVVVGVALLAFLLALLNERILHLLGECDGVIALSTGVILAIALFSAPSFKESLNRGGRSPD